MMTLRMRRIYANQLNESRMDCVDIMNGKERNISDWNAFKVWTVGIFVVFGF